MRHPSLISLSHDHHHGLALALRCRKQALGQLRPMGATGLRQRADEFIEFYKKNLVAHFRAEEEILFPSMKSSLPQSTALIEELLSEHEQIHKTMPQLEAGTGLAKLIFDLGDLLETHIRKEERKLFPLFEENFEPMEAQAIGAKLKMIIERRESQ